jgi:hypothetical protein
MAFQHNGGRPRLGFALVEWKCGHWTRRVRFHYYGPITVAVARIRYAKIAPPMLRFRLTSLFMVPS